MLTTIHWFWKVFKYRSRLELRWWRLSGRRPNRRRPRRRPTTAGTWPFLWRRALGHAAPAGRPLRKPGPTSGWSRWPDPAVEFRSPRRYVIATKHFIRQNAIDSFGKISVPTRIRIIFIDISKRKLLWADFNESANMSLNEHVSPSTKSYS